ncbi:MAG: serine/threonine-protein kinase [Planctomycetaceae bacterium]
MRVIGQGGMGIVLEAFDPRLQRSVAIKVLDPEQSDDEISRQRFCREARAAASITHEHVVAVHQVDRMHQESGGLPYLVMQLINGETLEERLLKNRILPVREIVRIALQAAQGLAAAHAQGLIHRDIKPGNILLERPADRVKLTDFGLARVADDVKLTRTGFVTGTPLYMAPEQAQGEEADSRSDLFSLGAILYEMSVGQPPFTGNSALAILKQITETKPRPIRELNPAIPAWLAETIEQLLEKKPEKRFQSAALLAELLEYEWALMKATSEEVPTVCEVEKRATTRRNRWIGAGIGAAFLCLGLLGGMFLSNRPPGAVEAVSSAAPLAVLNANAGTVWTVAFNPAGDSLAMAVENGSVRLWDWKSKKITSTFPAHRGVVWEARYSSDGSFFATAGDDGLVKLWKPSQSEPFQVFAHPNAVRGLALAHHDQTLTAGVRDGSIRLWSFDHPEQPIAETEQTGAIYAIAISPDDQTLASAGTDKTIRLWNAKTLMPKLPLEGHNGSVYGLSFHPDGTRLASAGWDQTVRIWDVGDGMLLRSWEGHDGDIWAVAYSPRGEKLATGGHDGAVKIWNADTGECLATYLGHKLAVHAVAFNHDGTLLVSGGRDGSVRVWNVE